MAINGNGLSNGHKSAWVPQSTRLRRLLDRDGIVVAPGVYDGITAHAAIRTGFECLYMSGAAVTASRLGLPDLAFASMDDFVEAATVIANLPGCPPLICDADTGFGSTSQIERTVHRYHRAGVAGLHIEDQVTNKRCGHLLGKEIVTVDEFVRRIKAAVYARSTIGGGSDMVIIARSDALQSHGIDTAISRLYAAVQAGADVAFLEGVTSEAEAVKAIAALAPTPVLLNLVAGGSTPLWSTSDCERMGAKLAIMPTAGLGPVCNAALTAYAYTRQTGLNQPPLATESILSPRDMFNLVGLDKVLKFDAAVGSTAYTNGV